MTDADGTSRRHARIGIRARVLIGYVTLLAVSLAISLLVTRAVLLSRLDREIDRATAQEVDELRRLANGTDPETGEPFADDAAAIFRTFMARNVPGDNEAFYTLVDGEPFLRSFNAPPALWSDATRVERWAATSTSQRDIESTEVGEVRWLAVPLSSPTEVFGTFVVAQFPGPERQVITQSLRIVMLAGGVVLVAAAALAWSLAGRVLRPVREFSATAHEISESDLSSRIPVTGHDELADLGRTFNDMLDRLESGFERQRQFLDDVAHELRTPITIAQGHLDLLGDDATEREETTAIITDELEQMSRYVADLLLLAQAEQPDFLRLGPVDLGEFAEGTLRALRTLADRRWRIDAAPSPGAAVVLADERRLTQAVTNLAANAVQHTGDGDTIALGVAIDAGPPSVARLWIRDTGSGIAPEIAASLFDRHRRGVASRAARPEGMGIGLSIVDAVARAHRGAVTVHSTPGDGARFELSIPAGDPSPDDTEEIT